MSGRKTGVWGCAAALVLGGCGLLPTASKGGGEVSEADAPPEPTVVVEGGIPDARDNPDAPVLYVQLQGPKEHATPVPYLYGYPLFAGGGGSHGLRRLRQDNWTGYDRHEEEDQDGVVRVREAFPSIGCRFEGIQQDETTYVPLFVQCDVPAPSERGGKSRPAVGKLKAGVKAAKVPAEPSLEKAFLGEWHITTKDFDGKNGTGYFNTAGGLLGFGFERGKLTSIAFLFDTPEKRWRESSLWTPP